MVICQFMDQSAPLPPPTKKFCGLNREVHTLLFYWSNMNYLLHYTNIIQALYKHYTNIIQALYKHYTNIIQALYKHYTSIIQVLYKHYTNTEVETGIYIQFWPRPLHIRLYVRVTFAKLNRKTNSISEILLILYLIFRYQTQLFWNVQMKQTSVEKNS